jgi:hypothetical protein
VVADPGRLVFGEDNLTFRLLLDRAGIPWVTRSDPRAAGRPAYSILRLQPGEDPGSVEDGVAHVGETKDPAALYRGPMVLIREDPGAERRRDDS